MAEIFDIKLDDFTPQMWNELFKLSNQLVNYGSGLSLVAGDLKSANYKSGSAGWRLTSSGDLEANNGLFRGDILAGTITIGSNAWHVDSSGNMWWGNYATFAAAVSGGATRIGSDGASVFTSITISGYIASGGAAADVNANSTTISGGKITANSIAADKIVAGSLVVGTNVGLGTAQDSAGVTTIIGNTVTTSFVNALSVTAGSVAAEDITGTTITGKTIKTSSETRRIELNSTGTYANELIFIDPNENVSKGLYTDDDILRVGCYSAGTGSAIEFGGNPGTLSIISTSDATFYNPTTTNSFRPLVDNGNYLGSSSYNWGRVYSSQYYIGSTRKDSVWDAKLGKLEDDTSPKLGGNLNANSKTISSVNELNLNARSGITPSAGTIINWHSGETDQFRGTPGTGDWTGSFDMTAV